MVSQSMFYHHPPRIFQFNNNQKRETKRRHPRTAIAIWTVTNFRGWLGHTNANRGNSRFMREIYLESTGCQTVWRDPWGSPWFVSLSVEWNQTSHSQTSCVVVTTFIRIFWCRLFPSIWFAFAHRASHGLHGRRFLTGRGDQTTTMWLIRGRSVARCYLIHQTMMINIRCGVHSTRNWCREELSSSVWVVSSILPTQNSSSDVLPPCKLTCRKIVFEPYLWMCFCLKKVTDMVK